MTMRFPRAPMAEEAWWQELVVGHLGLSDWELLEIRDELDLLSPTAQRLLRRHGLLWPPGCQMMLSFAERAGAGSILTGIDGDGILGGWRWGWLADLVTGRRFPHRYELRHSFRAVAPGWAGRPWRQHVLPWLRPVAQRAYRSAMLDAARNEPRRWDQHLSWQSRQRLHAVARASWDALLGEYGTLLINPLLDLRFLAALASAGGRYGFGDRTAAMRALFDGLLPEAVFARTTKALGDEIAWTKRSRDFAKSWDGSGVDRELVDEAALRREWVAPNPQPRTATLLQAAWLASAGERVQQPLSGGV
jgi:asparagine synthase (glutamine-hydrolysing)